MIAKKREKPKVLPREAGGGGWGCGQPYVKYSRCK